MFLSFRVEYKYRGERHVDCWNQTDTNKYTDTALSKINMEEELRELLPVIEPVESNKIVSKLAEKISLEYIFRSFYGLLDILKVVLLWNSSTVVYFPFLWWL